jgi:hypothetical protein
MTAERHLPAPGPGPEVPAHLEKLVETAKDYARGAKAAATQRAYAADWRHYTAWCRRKELEPLPPDPQVVGLYLAPPRRSPLPRAKSRTRCARSSGGSQRLPGIAPSAASLSTAPTATSPKS